LILFYKYFLLGVGIKRLFVQTYYKNISNKLRALKLDSLCFTLATLSIGLMFVFGDEVMRIIGFGSDKWIYNACLGIVYLNFIGISNGTRVILLNKDGFYLFIHSLSILVMIFGVVFGALQNSVLFIIYAGVTAEVLLAFSALLGRIYYEMYA